MNDNALNKSRVYVLSRIEKYMVYLFAITAASERAHYISRRTKPKRKHSIYSAGKRLFQPQRLFIERKLASEKREKKKKKTEEKFYSPVLPERVPLLFPALSQIFPPRNIPLRRVCICIYIHSSSSSSIFFFHSAGAGV